MSYTVDTLTVRLGVGLAKGLHAKLVQFIKHEWSAHLDYIIYANDVVCLLVVYISGGCGIWVVRYRRIAAIFFRLVLHLH